MHHRPTSISTQGVWAYMAVALVLQMTSGSPTQRTQPLLTHHLTKRSFFDIQCKGVYDKSIFARLDRICEDCYNLFRETNLHSSCRRECFSTTYFTGCLEALLLTEDKRILLKQIEYIGRK
ncbi:ion transport peptide isoform X2 [Atheta coriaria]|uniref:ion transport peptide isoform X2 n=1 Tax=Dalotia coriaria TaxID=877792 RepID=UPI0031F45991